MGLFKSNARKIIDPKRHSGLLIIFIMVFIILSVLLLSYETDRESSGVFNRFIDYKEKQELFAYLKKVQPLENEFYQLVNDKIQYYEKNINEKSLVVLEESIISMNRLLKELINTESPDKALENKLLFTQEIKAIRNMFVEQMYWLSKSDEISLEKSKAYFDEYIVLSDLRRDSLRNIFDYYQIQYLDMGDMIKYKIN